MTGDFGASADHAINEEFQFRLIATLPEKKTMAVLTITMISTRFIFHDTLSDGITYDKDDNLDSVVIESNGKTYNIPKDSLKYTIDTTDLESQNSFVVNIPDVKACAKDAGFDLNDGATITVTYTAHLNDKAYVNTEGGSTSNINKVYLTYSNNPKDESSVGQTPESKVYVYTYQLNNTKHQEMIPRQRCRAPASVCTAMKLALMKMRSSSKRQLLLPHQRRTEGKGVEMISAKMVSSMSRVWTLAPTT